MNVSDENIAELFEQYKDEVRETIGILDNELVAIEQDPTSSELIFSLFRHMHSLKGSSKMFNVDNIAQIAHRLEDLMSLIDKNNAILVSHPRIIDLLFKGNDIFREIISLLEEDISHTQLTLEHNSFIEEIKKQLDKIDRRDNHLIEAARKLLDELDPLMHGLEDTEIEIEHIKKSMIELSAGLALATLEEDGSSQIHFHYNGLDLTQEVRALEDIIKNISQESAKPQVENNLMQNSPQEAEQGEDAKKLLDIVGTLYNMLSDVATEDAQELIAELGDGLDMFQEHELEVDEMMLEFFSSLLSELKEKFQIEVVISDGGSAGKSKSSSKQSSIKEPMIKTIRVDEAKIDQFLDSVGKLITKSENLNHLQFAFRQAGLSTNLMRDFASVSRTISNDIVSLQRSIMEVRQVEINNILKKFPRLVRDISRKIDKEAELNIMGERVPIDKSLLDDVEQALVHIVRNAVDHGLETPNERVAAGKNRRGIITISVIQEEASIYIEVSDDGRGLDLDRIKNKAIDRGLISQNEAATMSDTEAEMLIFDSGVSTKQEATDLSGRGVGMDVVMTNIKRWNGEITVSNKVGQGLSVGLRLPVSNTLLTKEALLLKISDSVFCLPLEFVSEIVTVSEESIHLHKDQAVFRHRDMVISVINLKEMLGLGESIFYSNNESNGGEEAINLLLGRDASDSKTLQQNNAPSEHNEEKKKHAFIILHDKDSTKSSIMADEILGQQKIVIKEFELETFKKLPYFTGLTLLGDGRVVLILDSEKILNH